MDLLGLTVDDLQSDVVVGKKAITGTLKKVTGYTGFSGKVDEQNGNYIALHCEVPDTENVTIKAMLIGGYSGEVTLDEDGIIVFKVANTAQKVQIKAIKTGYETVTKVFNLTGLTLQK